MRGRGSTPAHARRRARILGRERVPGCASVTITHVAINRVAWIVTVLVALITALLLGLSGYMGYAGLGIAVAVSASINLL